MNKKGDVRFNANNANNNKHILVELQDYMFVSENMNKYAKHMNQKYNEDDNEDDNVISMPKSSMKHVEDFYKEKEFLKKEFKEKEFKEKEFVKKEFKEKEFVEKEFKEKETKYRPKQKDSLFWCFYILKNGFFKYEMEINNQYFVVEKTEKFKYIELIRNNKKLLTIHKLKPFTELEDDLANKDRISIKTFFALCVIENINVLLVNKRKVYELLCTDVGEINVVHRNSESYTHYIELETNKKIIDNYRDTYYKMNGFDSTLKAIGSYKLEELMELCKKLDITIETNNPNKKKLTKKDIYERLVLNY